MDATTFNPIQIHLLRMFELVKSEAGLQELRDVLYNYYSRKVNKAIDQMWESGELNQERLDEIEKMDLHKLG